MTCKMSGTRSGIVIKVVQLIFNGMLCYNRRGYNYTVDKVHPSYEAHCTDIRPTRLYGQLSGDPK